MAFPPGNNKSARRLRLVARLGHHLDLDHASVFKGHGLRRIRDARRNIGIEKRIVERIADHHEATSPMSMKDGPAAAPISAVTERSVRIRIRRVGIIVVVVNPGLNRFAARYPSCFLVWRSPSKPDRIHRHALTNLTGLR